MTFFIVLFLLLMQFLWRYIDELVGKGLELKIIGELMMYASSGLVPLALPLAILLSSLMSFGNMGEFYELTAIKASGISLRRVLMPLIIVVVLVSVGAFFFANNVLPVTNLKMKSLLYDVRQQRPEVQITEGVFYNGLDNYSIRVEKKDPITNLLYDIKIYDHTAHRGNIKVTTADSGQMKMTADRRYMVITLWDGYTYVERNEGRRKRSASDYYPLEIDKFAEQRTIIEMTGFELMRSDESIFRNSYQMLNISQLAHQSDSIRNELTEKSSQFYKTLLRNNIFKLNQKTANTYIPENFSSTPTFWDSKDNAAPEQIRAKILAARPAPREAVRRQPAVSKPDPVAINKTILKVNNFDSLYHSFSLPQQRNIIKSATNYSSMAQYMVVNTASNIVFETKFLRRHEIEWHRKFTLSFACLIFLFIGAPLGAIIRKGGLGMPTVISTLLFIMYYIISLSGEKFVRESVMSGFMGMWLSSFVLIIAGVFLTYQASNDSAILNIDTYLNWLRDKTGLKKGILLEKKTHITGRFELVEIPRDVLQGEFKVIIDMARQCLVSLKEDDRWPVLFHKAFNNTSIFYLIEFGIHYNSFIDQVILSKWFRIPYFQKRLAEFPLMDGRIAEPALRNKMLRWTLVVLFPLGIIRLLHLKIRVMHIQRQLKKVIELSSGMINLLNSAALKTEAVYS
jgi:lipopolysaccharide export system permease protein